MRAWRRYRDLRKDPCPDLVGRDQELGLIASFLKQAATDGATLLFTGEPGIGKTALLDAAAEAAIAAGLQVVRAAGSEFGTEASFSGLAQLLQPLSANLSALSSLHRRSLAAIEGDASEPQPGRLAVFQAALAVLGHAARRRPLLVIVDDLQWLDLPSASALGFVARRLAGLRVGFLAVSRSGAESFAERAGLASRELPPLDTASAAGLLNGRFPELALQVRQRLLAEAQGNPLALLELPVLLSGAQRAALAPLPSVLPLGRRLPALFAAQVSALPAGARRLLLYAALDGSGDLHVLAAAGETWAADLAQAEQARLVRLEEGTGRLAFRHPLIRSAVVELATDADCRQAHRALAEQVADRPERRAWHLGEAAAGPDEALAALLEGVAAQVLRRGDATGAVSALLRAAELSPARPDRSRRLAYAALVSASITMEISTVASLLGDATQAETEPVVSLLAATTTAFMLLNGDGDVVTAHRLMTQAIEDHSESGPKGPAGIFEAITTLFILSVFAARAELWASFHAAVRRFAADLPAELSLLDQSFADPVRTAAPVLPQVETAIASLRGETDHLRILMVSSTAHFTDRQPGCREALWRVVREVRETRAVTPLITALDHLSLDSWLTGQWDQAEEQADECLELCTTHGYLLQTWTIRYRQALLAAARGQYDAADALTAKMTEWAAPRRISQAELAAHHVGSVAALGRGDFDKAYQHAAAISPAGVLASHVGYALWVLLDLVEAAVRTGRHAEAAAHVRAMREADLGVISPRLSLIVAGSAALTAPGEQARGQFETALATPGADQWPFDLARVRLLYGEWLRRERSTAQARVQLSMAMNTFRQLSALPWQVRAAKELRAAGLAASPAADPASRRPALLTTLDRQIADLAAAGLTNKQIGERLYLSHRTVAAHLYQIFPRLGITSRAALRDALDALDGSGHAELPAAVR